jgi:hypothetical protein
MTEDVVAIQQLLHRYCFAEDSGTPDETVFLTSKVPQGASGGMNYPPWDKSCRLKTRS